MMRNGLAGLMIAILILFGCAVDILSAAHKPAPAVSVKPQIDFLVVGEPTENRPLAGRSRIGASFVGMLPLVPYGLQQISPERTGAGAGIKYDFLHDVSVAVSKDLRASGLAGQVVTEIPRGQDPPHYRLELQLDEGIWNRKVTLYGLSFAGVIVWMFAPGAYGNTEMAVTFELFSPSGESLGQGSARAQEPIRQWVFNPSNVFFRKLPIAFGRIAAEIREFVKSRLEQTTSRPSVRPVRIRSSAADLKHAASRWKKARR